jgi:hypothetical protein
LKTTRDQKPLFQKIGITPFIFRSKNTHTLFFRFTFLVFYFSDNNFVGKAYIVKEQYFQTKAKLQKVCLIYDSFLHEPQIE